MGPLRESRAMIAAMAPRAVPGDVVFCTFRDRADAAALTAQARGAFVEDEGVSLILPVAVAREAGLAVDVPMRQVTLTVHSALDGVGLTAAVAACLAEDAIPCNVVAAFHHDHIFVPAGQADAALAALRRLQARAVEGSSPV